MYYVYVLKNSRTKRFYIGYTSDLKQRLNQHQSKDSDWILVYYEAFGSESDARNRERKLKHHGSSWGHLKKRIQDSVDVKLP